MKIKKIIILSLIFSFLTFLLGIFFGYNLNKYLFEKIFEEYEIVKSLVESSSYLIMDESYCDINKLNFLANLLDDLGNRINIMQNSKPFFISENRFKLIKSQYFNLQYLHMSLARNLLNKCNFTLNIILYFYDDSIKCDDCNLQSYELSLLKVKYDKDLLIYSFDISYNNTFILYFKNKYSIDKIPSVVLIIQNKTIVFKGLTNHREIEKFIVNSNLYK